MAISILFPEGATSWRRSEWREGKKCKMLEEWTLLTEKAREAGLTLAQLQETLMQVFGKEQA